MGKKYNNQEKTIMKIIELVPGLKNGHDDATRNELIKGRIESLEDQIKALEKCSKFKASVQDIVEGTFLLELNNKFAAFVKSKNFDKKDKFIIRIVKE